MFDDDLTIGKRGEKLVTSALAARGHVIEDLSNNRDYQQKDIDMRLTKNGTSITLEVKNDVKSNYTGNVFIETYNQNNKSRGGDGWICYCEADYLCFVQENHNIAHIVSRSELIKNCWDGKYRMSRSSFSQGYIVPIWQLQQYSSYFCLKLGGYEW